MKLPSLKSNQNPVAELTVGAATLITLQCRMSGIVQRQGKLRDQMRDLQKQLFASEDELGELKVKMIEELGRLAQAAKDAGIGG